MKASRAEKREIEKGLKVLEARGYPLPISSRWGAKRAIRMIELLKDVTDPNHCPVCGRKYRD